MLLIAICYMSCRCTLLKSNTFFSRTVTLTDWNKLLPQAVKSPSPGIFVSRVFSRNYFNAFYVVLNTTYSYTYLKKKKKKLTCNAHVVLYPKTEGLDKPATGINPEWTEVTAVLHHAVLERSSLFAIVFSRVL